jgi:hypothetical protein
MFLNKNLKEGKNICRTNYMSQMKPTIDMQERMYVIIQIRFFCSPL